MDFKPQTASKTLFREPSPAISHLLKFAFIPEKRKYTLNVSIRILTDNKSLRKKVESSTKTVYKIAWLKIVIPLMSALFFVDSKRTSISNKNKQVDMRSPWCAPFSDLKCGVVNPPFIMHGCWSFNNTFIQ